MQRQVYSGKIPFYEITNDCCVIFAVTKGERPSRPSSDSHKIHGVLGDVVWNLMEFCWSQEPRERPTASDLVMGLHTGVKRKNAVKMDGPLLVKLGILLIGCVVYYE